MDAVNGQGIEELLDCDRVCAEMYFRLGNFKGVHRYRVTGFRLHLPTPLVEVVTPSGSKVLIDAAFLTVYGWNP